MRVMSVGCTMIEVMHGQQNIKRIISCHFQQRTLDTDEKPKAEYKTTHILMDNTVHNTQT
jgi:hypothetical protein